MLERRLDGNAAVWEKRTGFGFRENWKRKSAQHFPQRYRPAGADGQVRQEKDTAKYFLKSSHIGDPFPR